MHDEQLEALMAEFYATISGPAGPRDWLRERAIFHPQARLMRTGVDGEGRPWIRVMSVDDYIADTTPFFASQDFYEIEVARRVDRFGNVAQARSVYEARHPDDAEVLKRGVNLIQLSRRRALVGGGRALGQRARRCGGARGVAIDEPRVTTSLSPGFSPSLPSAPGVG